MSIKFFLILVSFSLILKSFADGGTSAVGGGGDTVAQDFTAGLERILMFSQKLANEGITDGPSAELQQRAATLIHDSRRPLLIKTENRLFLKLDNRKWIKISQEEFDSIPPLNIRELGAREVDGINDAANRIIYISRTRWRSVALVQRYALIMHEILGILGIDDLDYATSVAYREVFLREGFFSLLEKLDRTTIEIRDLSIRATFQDSDQRLTLQALHSRTAYVIEEGYLVGETNADGSVCFEFSELNFTVIEIPFQVPDSAPTLEEGDVKQLCITAPEKLFPNGESKVSIIKYPPKGMSPQDSSLYPKPYLARVINYVQYPN